ncbi:MULTISPECIES: hypothetical protein [Halorussus]|uniref:hypothetical protein n=1 Tax=Halorussus TaxID=1070314 RepID=UPI00209F6774|nr:hypothetical protein [Halorussus vallis]USZ74173.1 hypothetical protein NGM07_12000 [Halorussus vallis]
MRVRDAVEDDEEVLGDLADTPAEVMRNVIHDRTVRVAEAESDDADDEDPDIVGFVGFDADTESVLVTHLRGSADARNRLLEEPTRFARKEGMAVEVLVPESEAETREVVETAGFEDVGTGPRFENDQTVKYRLDPPRV